MNFILAIFFTALSFADCLKTWEKENVSNPVLSRCAISTIELVELESGCSLEGGKAERCFFLRTCDKRKEIGA